VALAEDMAAVAGLGVVYGASGHIVNRLLLKKKLLSKMI
jgi:hypothetical protein